MFLHTDLNLIRLDSKRWMNDANYLMGVVVMLSFWKRLGCCSVCLTVCADNNQLAMFAGT